VFARGTLFNSIVPGAAAMPIRGKVPVIDIK
jgi:hypothetical protein